MPLQYWAEAFTTSNFLINRLPSTILCMKVLLPFLDYSTFRVFGSQCYSYLRDQVKNKFDRRSLPSTFLNYSDRHKGYRYVYQPTGCIYIEHLPLQQLSSHGLLLSFVILVSPNHIHFYDFLIIFQHFISPPIQSSMLVPSTLR